MKLKDPKAVVSLSQSRALQQIRGEHLVQPDGTVNLGTYGSVRIVATRPWGGWADDWDLRLDIYPVIDGEQKHFIEFLHIDDGNGVCVTGAGQRLINSPELALIFSPALTGAGLH